MVPTILCGMLAALAVLGPAASPGLAQQTASATAKVVVTVRPHIAVVANAPTVYAGSIETGDFSATVGFRVEASAPRVHMAVGATGLHKAGDPTDPAVPPIPVKQSDGVRIETSGASPLGGRGNVAVFVESGSIDDLPAMTTERIAFESGRNGRFDEDVRVTVTWRQDDARKPPGEYSGKVRLMAMILP